MNTELQKCMNTDKDNHIIYFGEIVDAYVLEDKRGLKKQKVVK